MKKLILSLIPVIILFAGTTLKGQNATEGQKLFRANCAACHKAGGGKMVGPDMKGVATRRKEDWIIKFVQSSQTMIKAGDKTAVELFNANNKIVMPDQKLTPAQIKDILAYVKTW